jgi:hypothetical protein
MRLPSPPAVREVQATCIDADLLRDEQPWVLRGVARDWPLVQKSTEPAACLAYLQSFDIGRKVCAFLGEPQHRGRFFYNDDLSALNFVKVDTALPRVLQKLRELATQEEPATLYVGSTHIDTWLPGLSEHNDLGLPVEGALASLWLGNRSRVAAHFDHPRNVAVCVLGRRRFTVFPPEQVANLYVGPWDLTPAGQPISLVDFAQPDLERFPRFRDAWAAAQVAELEPGDALYLPGMWWHHVEGLAAINGLINYWWSETPAVYGAPADAFSHALLSIRSMPAAQRAAWRAVFDHYVFAEEGDAHLAHLPPPSRGRLGPMDDRQARQLRSHLINVLKR